MTKGPEYWYWLESERLTIIFSSVYDKYQKYNMSHVSIVLRF